MRGTRRAARSYDQIYEDKVGFLLGIARALQVAGLPAHRMEETLTALTKRLGLEGEFFASPSAIYATFGFQKETYLVRTASGDVNLERLDDLDQLAQITASGSITPATAIQRLKEIVNAPDPWGPTVTVISFGLTSCGTARLFGGGWREMLVAALISVCVGLLTLTTNRFPTMGRVMGLVSGFCAIVLAKIGLMLFGSFSVYTASVTGLIVLLPGLSLTVAMTELATGHPISGTARLAHVMVLFLMIGFGLALGGQLDLYLPGLPAQAKPVPLPEWTLFPSVLLVTLSFVVLFKAKAKDFIWIFMAGAGSYFMARFNTQIFGAEMGGFLSATVIGLLGNIFSRALKRPASIPLVPGIMLLVPGSIGFRSMSSLLAQDTLAGVESAFKMAIIAVALVSGLIVANAILPSRRDYQVGL